MGPSLQMNAGPNWQCPHNPTAHCMLRSIETQICSGERPRLQRRHHRESHHHLRPTAQQHRIARIKRAQSIEQRSDDADVAPPTGCGAIDGCVNHHAPPRPIVVLAVIQQRIGRACAVEQIQPTELSSIVQQCADRGTQGASPMPPVTITTSRPIHSASGQLVPNGPRKPSVCPTFMLRQSSRHVACHADRVGTTFRVGCGSSLTRSRSRRRRQVQHVELARCKAICRTSRFILKRQIIRRHAVNLLAGWR